MATVAALLLARFVPDSDLKNIGAKCQTCN